MLLLSILLIQNSWLSPAGSREHRQYVALLQDRAALRVATIDEEGTHLVWWEGQQRQHIARGCAIRDLEAIASLGVAILRKILAVASQQADSDLH
jgi:hypothetical protein